METITIELFQYQSCTQSPFYFFKLIFLFHKSKIVQICVMYYNYVNIICEFMYKKHEGANVNTHNEFGNDIMKMCLKYKKNWRFYIKLKILELCFYHMDYDFWWNIFCHDFSMFGHAHIFSSLVMVCTHLKCYTNDVHFIKCILCEIKWLKKLVDKACNILLHVLLFFFLLFFKICVLIFWLSFTHHIDII